MEPREFFIEDRLERFRLKAFCNLGESGLGYFRLEEVLGMAGISFSDLLDLPMNDAPNQGSLALRRAIANLYPGVSPEQVLVTTGTGEALYLAFHMLVKPKTKVALIWPAFQALYEIPKMLGAEIIQVPQEKAFLVSTWKEIDADLYILNHPHNPTGKTFSDLEWENLLSWFREKRNWSFLMNTTGFCRVKDFLEKREWIPITLFMEQVPLPNVLESQVLGSDGLSQKNRLYKGHVLLKTT